MKTTPYLSASEKSILKESILVKLRSIALRISDNDLCIDISDSNLEQRSTLGALLGPDYVSQSDISTCTSSLNDILNFELMNYVKEPSLAASQNPLLW